MPFSPKENIMSNHNVNQPSNTDRAILTADGLLTTPPGSPKILIHTRRGKCVGIYCDMPAKVLVVETRGDPLRTIEPSYLAMLSMVSPQTSSKVAGGYGTAVDHVLAMAFDDPSMDADLRRTLDAHEVVLFGDWPDVW
jgi:hypothetical protein